MGARFISSLLTLVIVSLAAFAALECAPGDATELVLGSTARDISPDALARIRTAKQLDKPAWQRYAGWLRSVAKGNLGVSLKTNRPVTVELRTRLPISAAIAFGTLALGTLIGVSLGLLAVLQEGRWIDHLIRLAAVAFQAVPAFLIGFVAIYFCSFRLGWLPLYGVGGGQGLLLPILTLSLVLGLSLARITRATLLAVIHEEYFLAALGKGFSFRQALVRHGLRNALTPLITWLTMRFAGLLGGIVLIESLFSLPGLGSYVLEAVSSRDYPVLQSYMLLFSAVVVMANFGADLAVRWVDPRAARERLR